MSAATDTLRTAETLREAGVPDRQASAHARATDEAVDEAVEGLATRADVAALRADMSGLRADMYRAMLIQTGVIIGAVVGLLRLIP